MENFIHSSGRLGFVYALECIGLDGKVKWVARWENIIPDEGRDYILNAALNAGSQFGSWYIGLYEGAYTPQADDSGANIVARATEVTAYTPSTRPALVPDPLASGLWANVGSPAEFTFTSAKTIRGGFISSSPTKSGVTGTLLSDVLAASPKPVDVGEILRVTTGLSLVTI